MAINKNNFLKSIKQGVLGQSGLGINPSRRLGPKLGIPKPRLMPSKEINPSRKLRRPVKPRLTNLIKKFKT